MDSIKLVDNSTLQSLRKCTTMVALDRIFGYHTPHRNFYLDAGTAIHKGLEHWLKHGPEGVRNVVEAASAHLPQAVDDLPDAYQPRNLGRIAEHFVSTVVFPFKVVFVEKAFRARLVDDIWINGKLDVFVEDTTNGTYAVLDWKTTGRLDKKWENTQLASSQFPHYLYALQRIYGKSVWTAYCEGIEIKKIPDSGTKCKVHGLPYRECGKQHLQSLRVQVDVWQKKMDAWYRDAVRNAREFFNLKEYVEGRPERLKELPMEGTFNGACYSCEYRDFCHLYNREEDVVDRIFHVDLWSPETDAEIITEEGGL